jgi:hypothetical protein
VTYYLWCPGSSVKSRQVNWQLERTLSLSMHEADGVHYATNARRRRIPKAVPVPSFLACDGPFQYGSSEVSEFINCRTSSCFKLPSPVMPTLQCVCLAESHWFHFVSFFRYELQDLHVTEILPQMVALSEAYLQIYEQQSPPLSKQTG